MEMRAPKGVFDIYPGSKEPWQDSGVWIHIEKILRHHAQTFNFKEIRTPIFEHLELFLKGVGEGSDIVTKEMYQFTDKGGRELALRPEGTAAVIRAYVENKIYAANKSSKLFYIAPMFRYERQQSGRYRQHHQFGAEAIGTSSPYQDVEIIEMAYSLYKNIGIQNLKLLINCVGSLESRQAYTKALESFLRPKFESLSADSKIRFEKNILRILDSKDPQDQELLIGCPNILEFLDESKKFHFKTVLQGLKQLDIPFEIEPKLVRGLDYYDNTVFEILSVFDHKTSLTIGGGGRYDGLIESYSGLKIPAVGFGTGIERIIQTLIQQEVELNYQSKIDAYIIPLEECLQGDAFFLAHQLRQHHILCDIELSNRKIKAAIPHAVSLGAQFAILIGDEEKISQSFKLKNLHTREEFSFSKDGLIRYLTEQKHK